MADVNEPNFNRNHVDSTINITLEIAVQAFDLAVGELAQHHGVAFGTLRNQLLLQPMPPAPASDCNGQTEYNNTQKLIFQVFGQTVQALAQIKGIPPDEQQNQLLLQATVLVACSSGRSAIT